MAGKFCGLVVFVCLNCVLGDGKEFKSVPTTVKTFENDTVLLPCYLENAGANYNVIWIKDDKVIVDTSDNDVTPPFRVRMYSNHSLQVTRVQPADTGEYVCEIIREEPWSPIRQSHAIEVLYPPSVVPIPEIGIVEVKLGDEVNIGCKATGVPQPFITWLKKGEPLEIIDKRSTLKFNATSRHLAGNYDCIANNGVGESARATIQLIIMHPPEVETEAQWVHTALGLRAQLQCTVIASPIAIVQWLHGHNPVTFSSRIITHVEGDIHYLVIRNVHAQDLGLYTCKAENRIGMSQVRLHLSGVANIAVFKTNTPKTHPTQTTYTLIWEVDSYSPIIEYHLWFRPYKPRPPQRDGVFIKEKDDIWMKLTVPGESNEGPVHTGMYVLRGLTAATVYEALVISRNRYGWSKPSGILHFATVSLATEEPVPTKSPVSLPVLDDDDDAENKSNKNLSNLYSTPFLISENLIPLESQAKSSNQMLSCSIVLIFSILVVKILF